MSIKWVRGTNSTIFLSCYKEDDNWYLMSKGYQIDKGFIPMSETIDPGILSLSGVNWDHISAYRFSEINKSGAYALKLNKFSLEAIEMNINNLLDQKYDDIIKYIMELNYNFIRLKQYTNDMNLIKKYYDIIIEKKIDVSINNYINENIGFFRNILNLINDDFSR